ncbi:MAG: cytotoxic translational repressor of toxin-antitoxin stability system [Proteobacteria bacterium]|nr:cytotoxic translational repressor of toxin-antitoxin stability system [Pseudomonadota bacterium]NDC25155.1 cytotoxic translational repressor of toxin-antitoxin stability system [Pseudomonadota bacterium]NDD05617.1 cytotoxic translational repressor of toxin-antitoxin stability system [Pseudomonadota bacterium]
MKWTVDITKKAAKSIENLPQSVRENLRVLTLEIQTVGPVRGNWPNYSKLGENEHHCHIKKGRPTYVACWRVVNKTTQVVEVYYAGTHENAPY